VISDEVAPADRQLVTARVVQGDPTQVLREAAASAGLLVLGSRGHGSLADALLGSVGQYCVHHAHCPVLIMRCEPRRAAA
jgi:nucleotide-binding universal stress UspA family protein